MNWIFSAIATKSTKGNNTEMKSSHPLPIIPFEMLEHMKENAVFLVAADPSRYDEVREELTDFGVKKIVFLDQRMYDLMKKSIKRWTDDGTIMRWSVKRIMGKMREMEYLIAEQNELASAHIKAFDKYRNIFRGKDVVIVGNGPTLKYYKPIPNAVHIGLNRAWMREDIPLDFSVSIDGNYDYDTIFANLPKQYRNVIPPIGVIKEKIFVAIFLDKCPNNYPGFSEELRSRDDVAYYYINNNGRFKDQILYADIRYHGFMEASSVITSALPIAIYTYPKRLYLVGCDTTNSGHFFDDITDDEEETGAMSLVDAVKVFAARFKMFARLHYPDTEIISINPVGLKGLFKDVYTDEYLASLDNEQN